ncbi:MAG: glycosyltransferase family 4 protein [Reichenbachiella sp.]
MSDLKILMIGPGDPSQTNSGLGKAAEQISTQLAKKTQLILIQPESVLDQNTTEEKKTKKAISISDFSDFKVISDMVRIEVSNNISPYWYDSTPTSSVKELDRKSEVEEKLQTFTEEIIEESSESKFDVIYAHDWITFKAALELKSSSKKPLVLHVHSLDYDRSSMHTGSWVFRLEQEAFEKADQIICVSKYTKKIIEEVYEIESSKITVVYNGYAETVYPEAISPFHEKIVLFVGRLTGQKGPTQFLAIAEEVHEKYPQSRFIMAGDGEMYKTLIEAGAHSSVASKFHVTGHLNEKDLNKLYAMSDVFCMPSVSEPFGLTALEAAGANLPIVISNNTGAAEVLSGARTSDFHDTGGFAREIVSLLKNDKLKTESVKRNTKSLNLLSWNQSVTQILDVLQKA